MTNLHESMQLGWIKLATPGSFIGLAANCATRPVQYKSLFSNGTKTDVNAVKTFQVDQNNWGSSLFGPQREKNCLQGFANNKSADQPAHPQRLISTFVIIFWKEPYLSMLQAKFQCTS